MSEKLKLLIDTLVDSFGAEPSSPSVVFSRLEDGTYYGSLVRYSQPFGKGKQVLYNKALPTLEELVDDLLNMLGASDVSKPSI